MTGRTKDAGWQVGARRTIPVDIAEVWEMLTHEPWLNRWSGLTVLERDNPCVRSLAAFDVVRVRTPESLVQLRTRRAGTGTTVAFHEEHLPDQDARDRRQTYWSALLDDLEAALLNWPADAE